MSNPVKAFALVKDGAIVVLSGDEDSVLFDADDCDGGRVVPLVEDRGERAALRRVLKALAPWVDAGMRGCGSSRQAAITSAIAAGWVALRD